MNDNQTKIIFNIVIILAIYFLFAKPILNFLGIGSGKGTKLYQDENDDPNSPMNGLYWQKYFYIVPMPQQGRRLVTLATYTRLRDASENVYKSFGYFTDDETKFTKALNECRTKAEVSLMAAILQQNHSSTLLSLMKYGKGSLPENGLSDSELQQAINYVKNLPSV